MGARTLLPVVATCSLAAGLAIGLAVRAPFEGGAGGAAPLAPGAGRIRPEGPADEAPASARQQAAPLSPETDRAGPGRTAPPPSAEPVPRDPLFFDSVPRPDPGTRDGPIAREHYEDGQPMYEGRQRQLADGTWVLDGAWRSWWPNGQPQEQGEYRDEREHGRWHWWNEEGRTIAEGVFEHGLREGRWDFWYESGGKLMDAEYLRGKGAGLWTLYHENGRKAAEGMYLDGEISGPWLMWHEDGSSDLERSGTYAGGERVGP